MRDNQGVRVRGIVVMLLVIAGGWTVTEGGEVFSVNIVGFSKSGGTLTAQGEVATLTTDRIPRVHGTGIPVIMKCSTSATNTYGELGTTIGGTQILHPWIMAPDAQVEEVLVAGRHLSLVQSEIRNGQLSTQQYGTIPVFFHFSGILPSTGGTNICIFLFNEDQLKVLRESKESLSHDAASPER